MVKPNPNQEEESEEEEEEGVDEPPKAKKVYSHSKKKGKKGKGDIRRHSNPIAEEDSDDDMGDKKEKKKVDYSEDDELERVESKMKSKKGKGKKKKGGKKKGPVMAEVEEQEEYDNEIAKMKFASGMRQSSVIGDNLLDLPDVKQDVTIEMDEIIPPSELATAKEDLSIEIPDSPRGSLGEEEINMNVNAVKFQSSEEDKVTTVEYSTAEPAQDSLVGELVEMSPETKEASHVVEDEEEPNILLANSDNIGVSPDADVEPLGVEVVEPPAPLLQSDIIDEKGKDADVTIDIPDSPRVRIVSVANTPYYDVEALGSDTEKHTDEDVLPVESNIDDSLGRPASPYEKVEDVSIDIPESPGHKVVDPFQTETSDSIVAEHTKGDTVPVELHLDTSDKSGSPDEKVETVTIDIPESPRDKVPESYETYDTNLAAVEEVHEEEGPEEFDSIAVNAAASSIDESSTQNVENMEEDSDALLENGGSNDIGNDPEVKDPVPSAKTIDEPINILPVDGELEIEVKSKEAPGEILAIEESKDMPPRRNYEPSKNRGKGIDDQEFNLPEDNDDTKAEKNDIKDEDLPPIENDSDLPWAMYKRMKEEEDEKENANKVTEEISEISDSNDEDYAPELNEDLPDPYEAMSILDTEDIELNIKTSPPSILNSTQQDVYNDQVQSLKQGIAEEEIKVYLDDFEEHVKQEILMIGNISLEEVQEEERHLREEHISFQQQQAKIQRTRQQEILQAMEKAKKYVMSKHKEKYRELRTREQHLMQKDRSYKDEIHREFRRSESQLRKALKRRKAEVKTMYGDLTFADGQYGGSKGRRWKIDWNRTPQPIQIRLKCLRGVKDKLPNSRYVLMVSLYSRLGGNVMKWSSLRGQQWGGATLPIFHDGEFFNIEMKIDQSVFTVCPSRPDMRPGMALVFELFILRGPVTPTDKVVGWACFPLCDAEFRVIEGKYKAPMLRGDLDPGIDKFEIIEKLMANDLENWLCNVYFEIIRLPRYMAGQKEYEVELQFTSGLLGAPNRTKTGEENIDGEKAIFGSRSDVNSAMSHHSNKSLRSDSIASSTNNDESSDNKSIEKPAINTLIVDTVDGRSSSSSSRRKSSLSHPNLQMYRAENLSADLRKRKVGPMPEDVVRPMTSVDASRKLIEEKGLQVSEYGSDESDYEDNEVYALKQDMGYKPVKGEPGMFYKIHYNTPAEVYARKVYTMMPKTPLLSRQKVKHKLSHMEILNTHSFAVKTPWSNKGHIDHKGSKKVQYIGRMLFSELGISQTKSRAFWAMLLMIIINFWIRMYLHYLGQWVTLQGFQIPINKFDFLPYTVQLNYQNTLLRTRGEIALIVIGPFTNIILFLVMIVISAFIQLLFERFPDIFSKFIMAFGIHCVLDPIWILIVDSALFRFKNRGGDHAIGDAFKLYYHFKGFYHNDNVTLFISIALTTFLYFVTIFCALAFLYMYFLRIHNNGRLMDVYWRLHGREDKFFIPYDLEISNEELSYICTKAEQWRGEEGERRKTAVYDYIWEQEEMANENWDDPNIAVSRKTGAKETTTHISIHTLHLDGLRELYRHFLKLPDGAIVEVFGEMNIPGIDEGVKQALIKRTRFQTMTQPNGIRKRSTASGASTESVRKRDNLKLSIDNGAGTVAFEGHKTEKPSTVDFLGLPETTHA